MLSTQLTVSEILKMLTTNPNTGVFALQTSDYPTGVTRAALLSALTANLGPTNSGNFDASGHWNKQVYAPGILQNGGGQIPKSPSADMTVAGASDLPVINPVGASAMGSSPAIITTPAEVQ